jgi:hypothetical protein
MKNFATLYHFRAALAEFDKVKTKVKNREYLDDWVQRVEKMCLVYASRSTDLRLSPRLRARNRDLEQNARGILAGLKFAIAFTEAPDGLLKPPKAKTVIRTPVDEANTTNTSQ